MITCFEEISRISRHFETGFDDTAVFLEETHRVRMDRAIMSPGLIEGRCLIPNVELLQRAYGRVLRSGLEVQRGTGGRG